MLTEQLPPLPACVDLYWLPLEAGDTTHCVRTNGRVFEWATARYQHRERCDLYHAALEVRTGADRFVELGSRISARFACGQVRDSSRAGGCSRPAAP